jgi:cyanophycinase
VPGTLALVGGDEFKAGNEEQDRLLARDVGPGPAFVVPTAAARQGPDQAVDHARRWFARFGLDVQELPVLKPRDAASPAIAERARTGGFFYLVGGDPGLVAAVLRGSAVWRAIYQAWRDGAALAGSSAGAMALCSHTLVRAAWPNRFHRRPVEALGVVRKTAVLPHYDTFGERWIASAQEAAPELTLLGIDERSAAVWKGGEWNAMGPGAVTIVKGKKIARFRSGEKVSGLRAPVSLLPR